MAFLVTIWNARGGSITDLDKKQEIINECKRCEEYELPHIFMIQEVGLYPDAEENALYSTFSLQWDRAYSYCGFQLPPYRARHKRCTLITLIPDDYEVESVYPIPFGFEDRSTLVVHLDNILFANIHAPSGNYPYANSCISHCVANLNMGNLPWVLGGDMNVPQDDLALSLALGNHYRLLAQAEVTHHKDGDSDDGNILDYFLAHTSVSCSKIERTLVEDSISDHNMVTAILE